jgi:hypothetical protein
MSTILQSPDAFSFSGNLKKFIVSAATTVDFLLMQGETEILSAAYMPGVGGLVEIDLKEIIDRLLTISVPVDGGAVTSQRTGVGNFTATIDTVDTEFTVIKGGVLGLQELASEFVDDHFLTWQSQEKKILQYQPEWLTVFATAERVVKCKAYYLDEGSGSGSGGVSRTGDETVTLATVSEGGMDTIDVSWGAICDAITAQNPVAWDVWFENAGGTRLSYIQRYQLRNVTSEENMFVWVNTLGGVDAVSFTGSAEKDRKIDHKVSELYDESLEEYQEDKKQEVKQSTGFLSSLESLWLEDFFYARKRYMVDLDGSLVPIVVVSSQVVSSTADDMFDYEFNYRMAADANLLNMDRVTSDLPAPEGLSDFFLFELLSALPVATYQPNLEFAVQSPFAAGWMKLSFSELWGGALPGLVDGTTILYNNGKLRTTVDARTATRKPKHGFESNTDNTLAYQEGTFSITFVPVEDSGSGGETPTGFNVWKKGEVDERGTESISVPVVPGVASDWFVYYDTDLELTVAETPWDIFEYITICTIRWDGSTAVITDHRHPVNTEWDEQVSQLWSPDREKIVAFTTDTSLNTNKDIRAVSFGSTDLIDNIWGTSGYHLFQQNSSFTIRCSIGDNVYGSNEAYIKSRSTDGKTNKTVQSGDVIYAQIYVTDNGSEMIVSAYYDVQAYKGVIAGNGAVPGQFAFSTMGVLGNSEAESDKVRFLINESGTTTRGNHRVLSGGYSTSMVENLWLWDSSPFLAQYDSYGAPASVALGDTAFGAGYIYVKSRSTDGTTSKSVQDGDLIGEFDFYADDGSSLQSAGMIALAVNGTPDQDVMPSRFEFWVRDDTGILLEKTFVLKATEMESLKKMKAPSVQLTTGASQWQVLTDKVGEGNATWEPLQKQMIEDVLTGDITTHTHSQYLTDETSHSDVLVDGDFTGQGVMVRGDNPGVYSSIHLASGEVIRRKLDDSGFEGFTPIPGGSIPSGTATGQLMWWDESSSPKQWKMTDTSKLCWDDEHGKLVIGTTTVASESVTYYLYWGNSGSKLYHVETYRSANARPSIGYPNLTKPDLSGNGGAAGNQLCLGRNGDLVDIILGDGTNDTNPYIRFPRYTTAGVLKNDADGVISSIANSVGLKTFWSGTSTAWDAIETKDANTIYFVEEEE